MAVRLSQLIIPTFRSVWKLIKAHTYTHYWFKGGRGSTKSSFISIAIVLLVISNPNMHAVCYRKIANTLRRSVFNQIMWAVNMLGVGEYFKASLTPLEITYTPTGQKIFFLGLDDPNNTKSIKLASGYIGITWYEELDQFAGLEEIRTTQQSTVRGDGKFWNFYSFNPPRNSANWVNQEANYPASGRYVHHSTYLDVPKNLQLAWLGEQFLLEAEYVKERDSLAYQHEYLGEPVGNGGQIFRNVEIREITDEEISHFDNIRQGVDWGYVTDPFAFGKWHYDKTRRRIYIFDEIYEVGMLNPQSIECVKKKAQPFVTIYADSSEPKSIADFRRAGLPVRGAIKGPDSRKFGVQWLQSLEAIIIDPIRCPNAAREFSSWELEKNKDGSFRDEPPSNNDHMIDLVRYGSEHDMLPRGIF